MRLLRRWSVLMLAACAVGPIAVACSSEHPAAADDSESPPGTPSPVDGSRPDVSDASTDAGDDAAEEESVCEPEGSCVCTRGTCEPGCQAGDCTFECKAGTTCKPSCAGGGCTFTCAPGATCNAMCPGGGCTFHCLDGAHCNNSCYGGGCTFDCAPTAVCNNSCPRENCN